MCIATPLDRNFSIVGGVVRSQTRHSSSTAKHAICLRLGGRLAIRYSYLNIQLTKISWVDEHGMAGFLRSGHIYLRTYAIIAIHPSILSNPYLNSFNLHYIIFVIIMSYL